MGYKVRLGVPGTHFDFGCISGILQTTMNGRHEVSVGNSGTGFTDMERVYCDALNLAEAGQITHFAMLHSDVNPQPGWLDTLIDVLDEKDADLISSVVPIKDSRGLTTTGIGDIDDPWTPCRRFTVREVLAMPEVFDAETAGYPGGMLLHNTGCWTCDLRKPVFYKTDDAGKLTAHFEFRQQIARGTDGRWEAQSESEDWHFSRKLFELKAKTFATRKVKLTHRGPNDFPNYTDWGDDVDGDAALAHKWRKQEPASVSIDWEPLKNPAGANGRPQCEKVA
jgi:hypothetical protein